MRNKRTVPRVCKQCGKDFLAPLGEVKRGGAIYCAKACQYLGKVRKVARLCEYCNKSFDALPGRIDKGEGRFCSATCRSTSKRSTLTRNCQVCGVTIHTTPSDLKLGRSKYCSIACRAESKRVNWVTTFWAKVIKGINPDDCWEWTGYKNAGGYGVIGSSRNGSTRAHRLSYEIHKGEVPQGYFVLHSCPAGDNPGCSNPAHLRAGTAAENSRDMVERGRNPRGEQRHNAVLTEDMVIELRRLYATGEFRLTDLAARLGVAYKNAYAVVNRLSWRHVA